MDANSENFDLEFLHKSCNFVAVCGANLYRKCVMKLLCKNPSTLFSVNLNPETVGSILTKDFDEFRLFAERREKRRKNSKKQLSRFVEYNAHTN